jgi:hypothetical protein
MCSTDADFWPAGAVGLPYVFLLVIALNTPEAPHAGDVLADVRYRFIEFRLPAAGDEDVGALGNELPGGSQADAAVASGNDRDFSFQFL